MLGRPPRNPGRPVDGAPLVPVSYTKSVSAVHFNTTYVTSTLRIESFTLKVYGFYVTGAGSETFGYLTQDGGALRAPVLLYSMSSSDRCNIQDQIYNHNVRFQYHTFEEHFPKQKGMETETKGGGSKTVSY